MKKETKYYKKVQGTIFGIKGAFLINIIETPGFMDSTGTDSRSLGAIYSIFDSLK